MRLGSVEIEIEVTGRCIRLGQEDLYPFQPFPSDLHEGANNTETLPVWGSEVAQAHPMPKERALKQGGS